MTIGRKRLTSSEIKLKFLAGDAYDLCLRSVLIYMASHLDVD